MTSYLLVYWTRWSIIHLKHKYVFLRKKYICSSWTYIILKSFTRTNLWQRIYNKFLQVTTKLFGTKPCFICRMKHLNSFSENQLLSIGLENDKLLFSPLYSFFVIRKKHRISCITHLTTKKIKINKEKLSYLLFDTTKRWF